MTPIYLALVIFTFLCLFACIPFLVMAFRDQNKVDKINKDTLEYVKKLRGEKKA